MCPQAPAARPSSPQVLDSASALHGAVLSRELSQALGPSPAPHLGAGPHQAPRCHPVRALNKTGRLRQFPSSPSQGSWRCRQGWRAHHLRASV